MDDSDEARAQRGQIASVVAGLVAGAAVWVFVDGVATASSAEAQAAAGWSWILPICSLISYVMINGMSFEELVDSDEESRSVAMRARLFLLLAVLIQLTAVVVSGYTMGDVFLKLKGQEWAGISLFASSIAIALACWGQRLMTLPPRDSAEGMGLLA